MVDYVIGVFLNYEFVFMVIFIKFIFGDGNNFGCYELWLFRVCVWDERFLGRNIVVVVGGREGEEVEDLDDVCLY